MEEKRTSVFERSQKTVKATAVSAITYGIVSVWMYMIGMVAAIFAGESDIAQIMVKAGLGIAGLLIIVFSTVTTTFNKIYGCNIAVRVTCNVALFYCLPGSSAR